MFISCQLYKSSFIDFIGGGSKGGRYPPLLQTWYARKRMELPSQLRIVPFMIEVVLVENIYKIPVGNVG